MNNKNGLTRPIKNGKSMVILNGKGSKFILAFIPYNLYPIINNV